MSEQKHSIWLIRYADGSPALLLDDSRTNQIAHFQLLHVREWLEATVEPRNMVAGTIALLRNRLSEFPGWRAEKVEDVPAAKTVSKLRELATELGAPAWATDKALGQVSGTRGFPEADGPAVCPACHLVMTIDVSGGSCPDCR